MLWRRFREQPTPEYARTTEASIRNAVSPNERLEHLIDPWTSLVIVPVFALANAGIHLDADVATRAASSPITIGIVVGLVVGKVVGITAATWLGSRRWLGRFPMSVAWPSLVGAATLAGIGFTVALLIADLTFAGARLEEAKIGILVASVLATVLSWIVFGVMRHLPQRPTSRVAPPIIDLADPVDPGRDHVWGSAEAVVTLVEYADFECPYCGEAAPIIRGLVDSYGVGLRYVFRHLPLTDVHPHAEMAAEVAESAGAQGKFWEMHDLLFAQEPSAPPRRSPRRRRGVDAGCAPDRRGSRDSTIRVAGGPGRGERRGEWRRGHADLLRERASLVRLLRHATRLVPRSIGRCGSRPRAPLVPSAPSSCHSSSDGTGSGAPVGGEEASGEDGRRPRGMRLRLLRSGALPTAVDRRREEVVPPIEELEPERLEPVHVSVSGEDRTVIARFTQEHLAPVVDQPRYVDGPVDFGDLSEDGTEKVVERDLSVEVDDQVMDLRPGPEVTVSASHRAQYRPASISLR